MQIRILPTVSREIGNESQALQKRIFAVFEQLEDERTISMPLCRPLYSVERGLYELRFSDQGGEYRVFYYIKVKDAIYVIHAMRKKRQTIDRKTVELLRARIRSLS